MTYELIPLPVFLVFLIITTIMRKKWVDFDRAGYPEAARKNHLIYGGFKIATQLIVIITGFISFLNVPSKNVLYSILILVGLSISILGDIALFNIKSDKVFMSGLFIFLITISLYATALTISTGFRLFDLLPGGILFVTFILLLLYFLPGLKKAFKIPIILYGSVWCFLIARAVTLFYNPVFSITQAILVTFGTIIFFYGDVRLAIWKFKNSGISLVSEPVTYAIGQLFIALSLAYFPL